jgi:hypothetical protein
VRSEVDRQFVRDDASESPVPCRSTSMASIKNAVKPIKPSTGLSASPRRAEAAHATAIGAMTG